MYNFLIKQRIADCGSLVKKRTYFVIFTPIRMLEQFRKITVN